MRTSTGSLSGSLRGISKNCMYLSVIGILRSGSSGATQIDEQGVDSRSLGLDHPEFADVRPEVVEKLDAPHAAGEVDVLFDQPAQVLYMRPHSFRRHSMDVNQLMVVAIDKVALHVEHVGETAGESRAEINARAAEHQDHAARHVLAAMIARPFDHGERAGIAHREALPGGAGRVQLTAGRAVQAGVAHDDRFARDECRTCVRLQDDPAARHALADVVVRFAFEMQMQAARVPDAETLPGGTLEIDD